MRKLISILLVLAFVGCVHIGVKPDKELLTVLQKSAISTVGYLVAKNNPDKIPDLMKWYEGFLELEEFYDIQTSYQDGAAKLSELISDDAFLQLQIKNAMDILEVTVEGPMVPEEVEKYKYIVDYFMLGVAAAPQSIHIHN